MGRARLSSADCRARLSYLRTGLDEGCLRACIAECSVRGVDGARYLPAGRNVLRYDHGGTGGLALVFLPVGSSDAPAGMGHVSFRAFVYGRLSDFAGRGKVDAFIALGNRGIVLGRYVHG